MAVRLEGGMVVANLHATKARNPRIPDSELVRAAGWAARLAGDAPAILAGDFNVDTARSVMIDQLDGYTKAAPGIDHVVARGAATGPYDRWTPQQRRLGQLRSPTCAGRGGGHVTFDDARAAFPVLDLLRT